MSLLAILGAAVITVGLVLVSLGALLAWREQRGASTQRTKGISDDLDALARLADALAKHPVSIRLVFLGVVLIMLGGFISGASGLLD